MKNLLYIVVVLVLVSCGKIQPEGSEIKTQEVKIEEFSALHLEGNFKVSYIQSTENKLIVETYPNIFENLKIKVKDKELTISEKRKAEGVEVYNIILYSSGKISKMKMQNSAEFNISSQMMMDDFSLKMEDNTKLAGAILSNKAEINLYDNARLEMFGKTLEAEVVMRDSAVMVSPYWFVNNLKIKAEDDVLAEISVDEKLEGKLKNNAKLSYTGNPVKKVLEEDKALIIKK